MFSFGRGKSEKSSSYGIDCRGREVPRGRRASALFLTGVLSFEAAFGNGLSLAFAEPLDGGQTIIQTGDDGLQLVVGDNSGAQDPQDPGNGGSPSVTEEDTPYDWTNDTERLKLTSGARFTGDASMRGVAQS